MAILRLILPAWLLVLLLGCPPSSTVRPVDPDHVLYLDDGDSISCKLVRGEILVTRVVAINGDSLSIENASIDRIVQRESGLDVTDRYIDRDALKREMAKEAAIAKRQRLRAEVAAGRKKKSELNRLPFAVLAAELEHASKGPPRIALSILNLTEKGISLLRTRVYCFDAAGNPLPGSGGRRHVFDATSRVPIGPGEEFTTILALRNHPRTRKAKIEIHYLEFSDRTWWKGKEEETVE